MDKNQVPDVAEEYLAAEGGILTVIHALEQGQVVDVAVDVVKAKKEKNNGKNNETRIYADEIGEKSRTLYGRKK